VKSSGGCLGTAAVSAATYSLRPGKSASSELR
jgi:hypothetical protein